MNVLFYISMSLLTLPKDVWGIIDDIVDHNKSIVEKLNIIAQNAREQQIYDTRQQELKDIEINKKNTKYWKLCDNIIWPALIGHIRSRANVGFNDIVIIPYDYVRREGYGYNHGIIIKCLNSYLINKGFRVQRYADRISIHW